MDNQTSVPVPTNFVRNTAPQTTNSTTSTPNTNTSAPSETRGNFGRNRFRRPSTGRPQFGNRTEGQSTGERRPEGGQNSGQRRPGGRPNNNQRQRGGGFGRNNNFKRPNSSGGSNFPRRNPYGSELYQTANALNWNTNEYQFKNFDGPKLKIIPISGVEMIGTNCTVFEYENDIMIIDAGLGFPEFNLVGIDALVPNLTYLADKLDKVRGLVITHGHGDHIGGLHYIYDKIGFPTVYAPRMAAEMIKEKFKETPFADRLKIVEIDGESSYYLGKFHLSHFRMNHTIMDNYGVCIDTPIGRVVTPSDYKFDLTPYKESPSDYAKLTKMGDEGILLLLDESTNIKKPGWSPSETAIAADLENVIRDADGRLIIGMFSTMISRIRQIIELGVKYNKKIAIFGRSMDSNAKIAHKLGYIDAANSNLIRQEEVDKYPDDQIIVLTTGSQGEPNAALMRMALNEHQKLTLRKSDTVVFSSSRIPGNEGKIDQLINLIAEKGCRILTNDSLSLHASGHGNQEDHKLMWQLAKPKFIMPIHGEPSHLNASKELAMIMGYKSEQIILTHDGTIIELWPDGWAENGKIESTPLWVEGNRVGDFDMSIIEERKVMTDEGAIVLTVKNFKAAQVSNEDIELLSKGFFLQSKDTFITSELPALVIETLNRMNADRDKETVRSNLRRLIENEVQKKYEKKPLVVVSLV
jgi:ribonuclease J